LKSSAAFPVTRKTNKDITSIASNGNGFSSIYLNSQLHSLFFQNFFFFFIFSEASSTPLKLFRQSFQKASRDSV
jgi:hypothetical protein